MITVTMNKGRREVNIHTHLTPEELASFQRQVSALISDALYMEDELSHDGREGIQNLIELLKQTYPDERQYERLFAEA